MKLKLIYYKNILDLVIEHIVCSNEDNFTKFDDKYVLSKQMSKSSLEHMLKNVVANINI